MRNGQLLFSAIQFFLIATLFGVGAVFFGFHSLPEIRHKIAAWIIDGESNFLFLGAIVTGIALLLSICFWAMQRGAFVRIALKKGSFSMHEALVRRTIQQFWIERFPERKQPTEIYCADQKIEIITDNQELEAIEEQLGEFLSKQFGYEREYFITLTKK